MTSEVVLFETFVAKPGQRDRLVDLLTSHIELVRQHEPGVRFVALHSDAARPEVVIGYERYADEDAFTHHRKLNAEHPDYQAFFEEFSQLLAAPIDVKRLVPLAGLGSAATD